MMQSIYFHYPVSTAALRRAYIWIVKSFSLIESNPIDEDTALVLRNSLLSALKLESRPRARENCDYVYDW